MTKMMHNGFFAEVAKVWQAVVHMLSSPYRPEQHYMRGARVAVHARKRVQ
jgi:hypothetical protein